MAPALQPWQYRLMAFLDAEPRGVSSLPLRGASICGSTARAGPFSYFFVSLLTTWACVVVSCAEATLGEALAFLGLCVPKAIVTHLNSSCMLGTIPTVLQQCRSLCLEPSTTLPSSGSVYLKINTLHPFLYRICYILSFSILLCLTLVPNMLSSLPLI